MSVALHLGYRLPPAVEGRGVNGRDWHSRPQGQPGHEGILLVILTRLHSSLAQFHFPNIGVVFASDHA